MRTIGLDVHRHFAEIAILEGKEERQLRISTEPQALRDFARTLGPDDQVVLEATANTWPIADLLAERGTKAAALQAERNTIEAAEREYRQLVRDRQRTRPPQRGATTKPSRGTMRGGGDAPTSALHHAVDRVRGEDIPAS